MAAERERRIREGQAKKAVLTAELARIEANRGQLGTSISLGHYLNVKDQLRQLKRDITLNKGLTPADVLATRRDPEPEEEDQTHPLVEWSKTAGPAFLNFLRNGAIALDDSAGVHTDEERTAAIDSLPSSFRRGVTQPVLSLPTSAMHQGSTSISRGLGNGPVHPEIYDKDPASRISNNVGAYAPYLIPGVGPALAAMQKADVAAQFAEDPVQAGRDLYDNAAPWKAKTPEERFLRSIQLVLSTAHVAKSVRVRARFAQDRVRAGQKVDAATVQQIVQTADEIKKSRPQKAEEDSVDVTPSIANPAIRPYSGYRPKDADWLAVAHEASKDPVQLKVPYQKTGLKNLRNRTATWLKIRRENQTPFWVPAINKAVTISGRGESKLTTKDPFGLRLVTKIPELLEKAQVLYTEKGKRGNGASLEFTRLVSYLKDGDDHYHVWMTLQRAPDGDWYYDHSWTRVEPAVVNSGG